MKKILISDLTTKEVPWGGAEWVNQVLIEKFNLDFEYSNQVTKFDKNNFYIISNISLMNPKLVSQLPNLNYIIIENDYKICHSRHPWRYPDNLVPNQERINYDLYKNAKAVFVQTTDHLNVFLKNDVVANFVNLQCSIWSENDLILLTDLLKTHSTKNGKYGVYSTQNWIKNTQGNIKFCEQNKLALTLLSDKKSRFDFLNELAKCEGLVFIPLARETFCRLVVEARCLGLKVYTPKTYGASLEPWFDKLSKQDLINFLREQTFKNLAQIETYLNI